MNKADLHYVMEFLKDVETIIDADYDGITWDLWDQVQNCKVIIENELGRSGKIQKLESDGSD